MADKSWIDVVLASARRTHCSHEVNIDQLFPRQHFGVPVIESSLIKNETDKTVKETVAKANAEAEKIKAEGEAQYMQILSEAYNDEAKADFYNYVRALDALKASLTGDNKTIILDGDSELARVLSGNEGF